MNPESVDTMQEWGGGCGLQDGYDDGNGDGDGNGYGWDRGDGWGCGYGGACGDGNGNGEVAATDTIARMEAAYERRRL